ncbi:MAG: (2Fe-2S)-binding protein [Aeromicrobium sp.]|uniref:(2Fe-2S)-binding protein n=1 Tax=Aeromicrobium sp. TaxID=1871063 RepID=UPI0039E4ED16
MTETTERLSTLGPFFALSDAMRAGTWCPLRELRDTPVLDDRVDYAVRFLSERAGAPVERRIAASTMSFALFARLLSPLMGAAALGYRLPALDWDSTLWQPVNTGPWPLALTGPETEPSPEAGLHEVVLPLAEVLSRRYSLSLHVLTGNITSAVFSAARLIGRARPGFARDALDLAMALLDGPLAGAGTLISPVDVEFVRNSCCLYYRVPGADYCGECILQPR